MKDGKILDRQHYAPGKIVIKEGAEAFSAYIVQSGRLSVYHNKDGKKVEISTLKPGDIFGETALIQKTVRSASVETLEETVLIKIHRDDFEEKLKKSDPTIRAVVDMLASRLNDSNTEVIKTRATTIGSFITLLNEVFGTIVESMPEPDREEFREEAYTHLRRLTHVMERYRNKF